MSRSTMTLSKVLLTGALAVLGGAMAGHLTGRGSAAHAGDEAAAAATYQVGSALPGLSPQLVQLFATGQAVFNKNFTAAEGLGPIYNEVSCVTCHGAGAPGGGDPLGPGATSFNVTHFAYDNLGFFDSIRDLGGLVIQKKSIRDTSHPNCTFAGENVPSVANVVSTRNTPPVFGFGLLDAIPDAEILKRQTMNTDGVNGFANWGFELQAVDPEPIQGIPLPNYGPARVGRFGWKAQTASLFQFSAEPFNIELGVSSPFFPQEFTPEGTRFAAQLPPTCNVADHAVNDFDNSMSVALYQFQALLAPPPVLAKNREAKDGEKLFSRIGCENCHASELRTADRYNLLLANGSSVRVRQLENRVVNAYSDLLLHDMGANLADDPSGSTMGRVMGRADGRHWRTTPLWGIRFKQALLHDGRTASIATAILEHGGEATNARNRFAALSAAEKNQLVAFLGTL